MGNVATCGNMWQHVATCGNMWATCTVFVATCARSKTHISNCAGMCGLPVNEPFCADPIWKPDKTTAFLNSRSGGVRGRRGWVESQTNRGTKVKGSPMFIAVFGFSSYVVFVSLVFTGFHQCLLLPLDLLPQLVGLLRVRPGSGERPAARGPACSYATS